MGSSNENLKNFIIRHALDINRRAFQTVYSAAQSDLSYDDIGNLSGLLINSREDVLKALKYAPDYYLFNNKSVTSITLPKEMVYIGVSSFACSGIQDIEIPENIRFIGRDAFSGSSLKNITFNNKIDTIGAGAFAYTEIRKIYINTPQISIYSGVFRVCDKLTLVEINANQIAFDRGVFYRCNNLREIHLPKTNFSEIGDIESWLSKELWSKKQVRIYCKDKMFIAGEENG